MISSSVNVTLDEGGTVANCIGRAIKNIASGAIKVTTEHTCLVSSFECEVENARKKIKEVALSSQIPPSKVLAEVYREFPKKFKQIVLDRRLFHLVNSFDDSSDLSLFISGIALNMTTIKNYRARVTKNGQTILSTQNEIDEINEEENEENEENDSNVEPDISNAPTQVAEGFDKQYSSTPLRLRTRSGRRNGLSQK